MLISRERSLLLIVDIQEKLAPAIDQGAAAIINNQRLISAAQQLVVPVFVSEQYVKGLGASVSAIKDVAVNAHFFEKIHFSCTRQPGVLEKLKATGRPQVILTGMETHVCVLQTAMGLREAGFDVFLVANAASSRTPESRTLAIARMRDCGVHIVTTEMVVFEWLEQACTDDFRALLPLIK